MESGRGPSRELRKRRKELLENLQNGLIHRKDLSKDDIWILTKLERHPSEENKKILEDAGLDSKSAEELGQELEDEVRSMAGLPSRGPKDKKKTPTPITKGETKKEDPPVKKEPGPVVKKEPEPKSEDPFGKLTDKQKEIKRGVEEALDEHPERATQDETDLMRTVFGDKDLIDLFFPDGEPLNPGGKSSKELGQDKKPDSRDMGSDGFGTLDQLGGGVGGMLGGGASGAGGGSAGPSARGMTPQPGGGSGPGETHQHQHIGGTMRDA